MKTLFIQNRMATQFDFKYTKQFCCISQQNHIRVTPSHCDRQLAHAMFKIDVKHKRGERKRSEINHFNKISCMRLL